MVNMKHKAEKNTIHEGRVKGVEIFYYLWGWQKRDLFHISLVAPLFKAKFMKTELETFNALNSNNAIIKWHKIHFNSVSFIISRYSR